MNNIDGIVPTLKQKILLLFPAFTLGFASIIVQLVFFREFALLFSTNELIYAILLSFWLVFTGTGATTARFVKTGKGNNVFFLSALFPIILIVLWILIPFIRNFLIPEGESASPAGVMIAATLILLPVCFLSGMLYVEISSSLSGRTHIKNVYVADVSGAIAGSLVFYFSTTYFNPFTVVLFSTFIFILSFLAFSVLKTGFFRKNSILLIISAAAVVLCYFIVPDLNKSAILPAQNLLKIYEGINGKYIVTKNENQYNLYSSSAFLYSSDYGLPSEEFVHTAMLQHDNPQKVLVINGYSPEVIKQLGMYNLACENYIEQDRTKIIAFDEYFAEESLNKNSVVYTDPMTYIDTTSVVYDVVLLQLNGISNLHNARFLTVRFFKKVKEIISSDGIFLINWNASSNYYGGSFTDVVSILKNTMKEVFENVKIIPLTTVFIVASESGEINQRIGELSSEKGISCDYVNSFFIDDNLLENRIRSINNKLTETTEINTEEKPVVFLHGMVFWLSQFRPYYFFIPLLLLILIVVIFAIKAYPNGLTMHITGFVTTALMTLLLLLFVYTSGSMLRNISIFFAVSMAGMAAGSIVTGVKRIKESKRVLFIPLIILVFIPLILVFFQSTVYEASMLQGKTFVLICLFVSGICGGMVYGLLSQKMTTGNKHISSLLYSNDMWGSFAGGLLCSLVLIPFINIAGAALIISGLAAVSVAVNVITGGR